MGLQIAWDRELAEEMLQGLMGLGKGLERGRDMC